MFRRSLLTIIMFAVVLLLTGCGGRQRLPPAAIQALEMAETIELYSLDPDRKEKKPGGWVQRLESSRPDDSER